MRYRTELLSQASAIPAAHESEMRIRCGRGASDGMGAVPPADHVVLDTQAHPIKQVICYAERGHAEALAALLNAAAAK